MGLVRLLLALVVVFAHLGQQPFKGAHLVGGILAVQSFFAISGFYMALVLNERYDRLSDFYFNRALRLYPSYWFVLIVTFLVAVASGHSSVLSIISDESLRWDGRLLMLLANLTIWGSDAMLYFYPSYDGLAFTSDFQAHSPQLWTLHSIPPAWSLPLEMMFYAIAPFLVRSKARLVVALAISLGLRWLVYRYVGSNDPWSYRFFPLELCFFCAGALAYHLYTAVGDNVTSKRIGVVLIPMLCLLIAQGGYLPQPIYILFAVASLPFVFAASKVSTLDRWLGDLSYPVYLSHWTCIELFGPSIPLVLASTLVVSVFIAVGVQNPSEAAFKRRPKTYASPAISPSTAAA